MEDVDKLRLFGEAVQRIIEESIHVFYQKEATRELKRLYFIIRELGKELKERKEIFLNKDLTIEVITTSSFPFLTYRYAELPFHEHLHRFLSDLFRVSRTLIKNHLPPLILFPLVNKIQLHELERILYFYLTENELKFKDCKKDLYTVSLLDEKVKVIKNVDTPILLVDFLFNQPIHKGLFSRVAAQIVYNKCCTVTNLERLADSVKKTFRGYTLVVEDQVFRLHENTIGSLTDKTFVKQIKVGVYIELKDDTYLLYKLAAYLDWFWSMEEVLSVLWPNF